MPSTERGVERSIPHDQTGLWMKHYGSIAVDKGKHLRSHFLAMHVKYCRILSNAVQQCAAMCSNVQQCAAMCSHIWRHHCNTFIAGLPYYTLLQHAAQLCNATAESKQIKTVFLRAELQLSLPVLGRHQKSKLCSALSTWVPSERCQHHGLDAQPMSWWWW